MSRAGSCDIIKNMPKLQIKPRSFNAGHPVHGHSFLYRLVSSQRFLAIVGLSLFIMISLPLARTYSQKKIIEQEVAEMQETIRRYEQETAEFREMMQYLDSDQSLESQARLTLNLKKPGEMVVVIEREEDKNQAVRTGSEVVVEKNNFKKWREYFFGI